MSCTEPALCNACTWGWRILSFICASAAFTQWICGHLSVKQNMMGLALKPHLLVFQKNTLKYLKFSTLCLEPASWSRVAENFDFYLAAAKAEVRSWQ